MKTKFIYFCIAVGVCTVIGFLSGFVAQSSVDDWYLGLNKPDWSPPVRLFAPVWIVLYILMGVSAGIVWAMGFYHKWVQTAIYHFGLQLLLNALWSIMFFGLQQPFWALLVALALLVLLALTIKWFNVVSHAAAYMLIPHFLWGLFIALLNYRVWEMN